MSTRLLLAAGAAAIVLGSCGDADPSPPTPADLRALDVSPDHTITVDEQGFRPDELEVHPGEVVLLVNEGDGLHSFTAEERFDTGRLQPGEETTLLLTEPGEIPYVDVENPEARGTLTVVDDDA